MTDTDKTSRPLALRLFRAFATPLLLAGCLVVWFIGVHIGLGTFGAAMAGTVLMLFGILLLEKMLMRPDLPPRTPGSLRVDYAFNFTSVFAAIVIPSFIYIPFGHAAAEAMGTVNLWGDMALWQAALLSILAVDFFSYWWHRIQHTCGDTWLWRLHSVHHATTHYDFWMGARVHPFDVLGFGLTGYGLVSILGAPQIAVEFTAYFAALVGAVHHTGAQTDCSWFNRIIPMGDHHIMHHSRMKEHNGNYGNITTFFDQLFGTYIEPWPETTPPQGAWSIVDDYPQNKFWYILLSPFGRRWKEVKRPL